MVWTRINPPSTGRLSDGMNQDKTLPAQEDSVVVWTRINPPSTGRLSGGMNQDKPSQHRKTVLGLRNINYFLLLTCATIHMHSGWSSLAPNGQFSSRKVKQRPRQKRLHILSSVLDGHCFCINLDATHAVRRYETLATLTSALVVGGSCGVWIPTSFTIWIGLTTQRHCVDC